MKNPIPEWFKKISCPLFLQIRYLNLTSSHLKLMPLMSDYFGMLLHLPILPLKEVSLWKVQSCTSTGLLGWWENGGSLSPYPIQPSHVFNKDIYRWRKYCCQTSVSASFPMSQGLLTHASLKSASLPMWWTLYGNWFLLDLKMTIYYLLIYLILFYKENIFQKVTHNFQYISS